jgi:hypothetical protein
MMFPADSPTASARTAIIAKVFEFIAVFNRTRNVRRLNECIGRLIDENFDHVTTLVDILIKQGPMLPEAAQIAFARQLAQCVRANNKISSNHLQAVHNYLVAGVMR